MSKVEALTLTVASVDQLKESLSKLLADKKTSAQPVSLAISGNQVFVCPFNFDKAAMKNFKQRLAVEAVDVLSLPVGSIELDYQVFEKSDKHMSGYFICLPQKNLFGYLNALDQFNVTPVKVTAYILASVEAFLKQHTIGDGRECYIDFSKPKTIDLAVFSKKRCELVREIPYENFDEAGQEVIQSLRSALAKSSNKQFDYIFIYGDLLDKEKFSEDLKNIFGAKVEHLRSLKTEENRDEAKAYFSLNLIRKHCLLAPEKMLIKKSVNAAMVVSIFVFVVFNLFIGQKQWAINKLKSSFTKADYEYALKLQDQIKEYEAH